MRPPISFEDISILMPIKNGREFVESSLLQISQMARGAEVIIVDDGSTDGSYEYCVSFASLHRNVSVYKCLGAGICDALNQGVSIATKNWIARFDVDDTYQLNRLSEQIKVLNKTEAILVFSDYTFYGDGIKALGMMTGGVLNLPTKLSLITGRRTPHPSAIFSKKVFLEAGGYLSQDAPAEDLSLWLRMCPLGDFATSENSLLNYRLSASSTTLSNRADSIERRNQVLKRYPINSEYFHNLISNLNEVMFLYSGMRATGNRTALLLLDIIRYSSFYGVRITPTKRLIILRKFMRFQVLIACLDILIQAKRRSIFRRKASRSTMLL